MTFDEFVASFRLTMRKEIEAANIQAMTGKFQGTTVLGLNVALDRFAELVQYMPKTETIDLAGRKVSKAEARLIGLAILRATDGK